MWFFNGNSKKKLLSGQPEWVQDYWEQTQRIHPKTLLREVEFEVIDLEATGLDVYKDRIISYASVPVQNFEILPNESFSCYISQSYFDWQSIPIHGLLRRDIEDGLSEQAFLETIVPRLSGKVIVGHHIGYDIAMINQALSRHFKFELINPVIDTGDLYRKTFPSKFAYDRYRQQMPTLDEIAREFEIKTHHRHSAMGDATITAFVFMKLWKRAEQENKIRLKHLL